MRSGGQRVLTDPVWGACASPSRLVDPKRFQPVPVALSALPPPDLVIVSHDHYDHYDHLDYPTIRALARSGVRFVTSLGVEVHREAVGVPAEPITELDWWEQHTLPGGELSVSAAPLQHFSGRGLKDRHATLLAGALRRGVQLVMPRLGEPVEPVQAEQVLPWRRSADARHACGPTVGEAEALSLSKMAGWPLD